jgi:tetratricopeptide (TPR) repeat protein
MASLVGTRVALGLAVILSVGLTVATAHAEDKNAAKEHWERGTRFYDIGKYDDAIKEFEAAYEAKSDPAFLYNLAQSHRLAGHTNEALRLYRTYLRYVPKAPNRGDIEDRIKELEKAAADKPATEPSTPATTPPATTGGTGAQPTTPSTPPATGTTPPAATWPPPAGTTPGGDPYGQPGAAGVPPGTAPYPGQGAVPPPAEAAPDAGAGRRKLGLIVAGSGGGLVVVGMIFGGVAKGQSDKVEKAAANHDDFDPSVESLGKTAEVLQWVGYGLGLAAVATGLILYATAPSGNETGAQPRVAFSPMPTPALDGAGASLRVAF